MSLGRDKIRGTLRIRSNILDKRITAEGYKSGQKKILTIMVRLILFRNDARFVYNIGTFAEVFLPC
jgi:hypothetical protein